MTRGIEYIIEFTDKFSNVAEKYVKSFDFMGKQTAMVDRAIDMIPQSVRDLETQLNTLKGARDNAFNVNEIKQYNNQIQNLETQIRGLQGMGIDPPVNTGGIQKMLGYAKNLLATLGLVGGVGMAINFGNESVDFAAQISDGMASVAKTTGISDENMLKFRKTLQGIDTRTKLEELLKIGEIGGQLGISEKDILGFTKVTDQMSVALKNDFGSTEEVAQRVGVLSNLFPQVVAEGMPVPELMSRIGSTLNGLGDSGAADARNVADFVARLAPAMKSLSFESLASYGAILQEMKIDSEVAASGMQNFFGKVIKETDRFAQVMGMTEDQLLKSFDSDEGVNKLVKNFARLMGSMENSKQLQVMSYLKLDDNEARKTIGALIQSLGTMGKENPMVSRFDEMFDNSKRLFSENISLQKEFDKMNNTLAAKLEKQSKKYDDIKLQLGEMLVPYKLQAMELGSGILDKIVGWTVALESKKGLFESMAVGAGVFGGALLLANIPALSLLGTQLLLAVTNPFALTIAGAAAVAGLFGYLYYQSENFRGILWAIFEGAKVWFEGFYNVGKTFIGGVIDLLTGLGDVIVGLFELDFGKMGDGLLKSLGGLFKGTVGTLISGVGEGIDKIPKIFTAMSNGFVAGQNDYRKDNAPPDYLSKFMGSRPEVLDKVMGSGNMSLLGAKAPVMPVNNMLQVPKGMQPNLPPTNLIPNSPFGDATTNTDTKDSNKEVLKGLDTVSGGGSKPTTINITIGKLNESIVINTTHLDEGSADIESKMTEILLRVVNSANQGN